MSGDRSSGCRSSAAIGISSAGRSSSGGKAGSGSKHSKGATSSKKAGWEDAGIEFYREAYPGALENLYDNSLRTLLPSKRYSIGTLGRATARRRSSTRNARRRRQSSAANTLVQTTRRGSDTYLEVMPDLTQGVDEEETWEELQTIRLHAVSLQEKRHLKRQLLSAPTLRTRGFAAMQLSRRKFISRMKLRFNEVIAKFGLWHRTLRYVEGNFGTGLVAFFTFIKWLLFLNLFSSILIVAFIIVPQVLYSKPQDWCSTDVKINVSDSLNFNTSPEILMSESTSPSSLLTLFSLPFTSTSIKPSVSTPSSFDEYVPSDGRSSKYDPKQGRPSNYGPSNDHSSKYVPEHDLSSNYIPSDNVPLSEDSLSNYIPSEDYVSSDDPSSDYSPSNYVETEDEYEPITYDDDISYADDILSYPSSSSIPETTRVFDPHISESSSSSAVPEISEANFTDVPFSAALFLNENDSHQCCYEKYKEQIDQRQTHLHYLVQLLLDFLQGTGVLQVSYLFYGFYPRANFSIPELYNFNYRLPLAYLCVMVSILTLCLILMVRKAATGLKDRLRSSEGQFYQFSNLVFGGWDHCIENNKAATFKKKAIYNELKNFLETVKHTEEKELKSRKQKCRLYLNRLLINLLVVCILIGSFFAIYKSTIFAFETLIYLKSPKYWSGGLFAKFISLTFMEVENNTSGKIPWWQTLILEFLPVGIIVAINIIVPKVFKFLIQVEKYSPNFGINLTLVRIVFLRLSLLVVFLFTLYQRIRMCKPSDEKCFSDNELCGDQIRCWETYVGRQLYKLTLLDLVIMFLNTFLINFPRKVLGHKILRGSRIGEAIGDMEFEIPKHVIDVVYGQTLCWLGMFYSPLLPPITCVKLVFVYYIKYFDCTFNTTQSSQLYRTSRSNSLFISILLISFIVTIIPVGFSIAELRPSISCGPFYDLPTIWNEVINLIEASPRWLQDFLFFLGTAGFAVPTIILLILIAYFYYAVAAANKHMVSLLKHQLVLEGHDKQFLLMRLDRLIKRTRELEDMQRSEVSSDPNGDFGATANDLTLDIRGGN